MLQGRLRMMGRDIRMALLAVINRFLQMRNSLFNVRVRLDLLARFGMAKSGFRMRDEDGGMTRLAILYRLFRMAYGGNHMLLGQAGVEVDQGQGAVHGGGGPDEGEGLPAVFDRGVEMNDAFLDVLVLLGGLGLPGVLQRGFGVSNQQIRMA